MSLRSIVASRWTKAIGTGLMVGGFILRNIDYYPSVLKLIDPEYAHGQAALQKVNSGTTIHSTDEGFDVIAKLVMDSVSKFNSNVPPDVKVDSMWIGQSVEMLGQGRISNLQIRLSSQQRPISYAGGGQDFPLPMSQIVASLEQTKRNGVFTVSQWLFFVGLIMDVASLVAMPKKTNGSARAPAQAQERPANHESERHEHQQENVNVVVSVQQERAEGEQQAEGDGLHTETPPPPPQPQSATLPPDQPPKTGLNPTL
jgi:hypothetical protein